MINIIIPFAQDKNLGKEYNRRIRQLPEDEWVTILDYDVLLLTPNAVNIMEGYAMRNPGCLLTCFTNRIHPNSPQLWGGRNSQDYNIRYHIEVAKELEKTGYEVEKINTNISGFLMLFPVSLWKEFPFAEDLKCLGVDSDFSQRIVESGRSILLMKSLYCFHIYRALTGIENKEHLL